MPDTPQFEVLADMIMSRKTLAQLATVVALLVMPDGFQHAANVLAQSAVSNYVSAACSLVSPANRVSVGSASAPAVSVKPPEGFNPLTATDVALGCYGFPLRPSNPEALKRWQTLMGDATQYVVPTLQAMPSVRFAANGAWSGYHAQANANGSPYWTQIDTENESVTGERSNDGHHIGNWVGFGGWNLGTYLTQVGTLLTDDGSYNNQGTILFFTEWVNTTNSCCSAVTVSNLPVSKSNDVYYQLNYVYQSGYSSAFFENKTTGKYTNVDFASGKYFNNDTAEWEAEDADAPPFTSYYGEDYLSPEVYTSAGSQQYAANLIYGADWMGVPKGTTSMKPSPFQTDCCHRFFEVPQS